ncbi:MAG TPA: transcriptional repressor [Chitinivibrionales bacterium]|nr:transcriptional repressor [Chitinivibrionales bacterium]
MQYRRSQQRERILEILKGTKSHPTADWIYKKLKEEIPELSLGTVYRNLHILISQGHIQKLPFGSTFDRFEAKIAPHYHLVCEKCGAVIDFEMPEYSDINKKAERLSSFKISRHRIDFFGLCEKCQIYHKQTTKRKGK